MAIDKVIHYCWFGNGELSDIEKKCIESWKLILPDYEIVEWNEKNFPIDNHPFAKEALEAKKWAFVSDYVRVWVLYNYGGVYLDTDYEIRKSIDNYLQYKGFLGVENKDYVGTAIMGFEKKHWLMKLMLEHYNKTSFLLGNGQYNMIPNTMILTDFLVNRGYKRGGSQQLEDIFIESSTKFYPKNGDKNFCVACGVHYFRGSWWSEKERRRSKNKIYIYILSPLLRAMKRVLRKIIGPDRLRKIEMAIKNKIK